MQTLSGFALDSQLLATGEPLPLDTVSVTAASTT